MNYSEFDNKIKDCCIRELQYRTDENTVAVCAALYGKW